MKNLRNPDALAQRRFDFLACIALAAVAVILYLPTLGAEFVYDAKLTVRGNDYVHHLPHLWDVATLRVMHLDVMDNNRPVYLATVMLNWALWGANPLGHHLCNLILHGAVVVLLFKLCRVLLPDASPWAPFAAALIYAVHPQNCEAVSEISYRNELLVGVFALAALNLATVFQPVYTRRNLLLGAAITACAFLAIGSKENGVVVPPLLACYWLLYRRKEPRAGWIALCAAASVVVAAFLIARFTLRPEISVIFIGKPARIVSSYAELATVQPKIWTFYLRQIVWPKGFCADYGPYSVSGFDPTFCLVVVVGVLATQVFFALQSRAFAIGMALFWLALLPVSNIVPIYRPMADRFMYVPMAGVAIMLASIPWPRGNARRIAMVFTVCAACALGWITFQREKVWHDGVALWSDGVVKNPLSWDCWNNLGSELYAAGRYEEAIPNFKQAIKLTDGHVADHFAGIALAQDALGHTKESDAAFRKATALDRRYAHSELLLQALIWEKPEADKLQAIADRNKSAN